MEKKNALPRARCTHRRPSVTPRQNAGHGRIAPGARRVYKCEPMEMATVGCPFLETRRGVVAERPKLCELMDIYLCMVGLWVHEKNTHVEKKPCCRWVRAHTTRLGKSGRLSACVIHARAAGNQASDCLGENSRRWWSYRLRQPAQHIRLERPGGLLLKASATARPHLQAAMPMPCSVL